MPVNEVGYRSWDGEKTPAHWRWWIITKTGVRLAFKSVWVKRLLFAAWLPLLYWGAIFLFVENAILVDTSQNASVEKRIEELQSTLENALNSDDPRRAITDRARRELENLMQDGRRSMVSRRLRNMLGVIPTTGKLLDAIDSGDSEIMRREIWRWLLMTFFRYPQALMLIFLVGAVAPGLISQDIQSRAFLVYFSKPIGRWEYIFGKFMIPASFIVAVTTLPALVLYFLAIMASPDFSVIFATWDIPFRIIAATGVVVVPVCLIALMLSSLTQESRFASFSWFAVWVLGHGAYLASVLATAIQLKDSRPSFTELNEQLAVKNWSVLSIYNCLGDAQNVVFGFTTFAESWRGILVLTIVSIVALVILYRRVSSPTRI